MLFRSNDKGSDGHNDNEGDNDEGNYNDDDGDHYVGPRISDSMANFFWVPCL